jgi:hypothetical protein
MSEEKAESEKVEQVARAILSAWDRLEIDGATHPFVGVNLSVDAASYLARAAIAAMEPIAVRFEREACAELAEGHANAFIVTDECGLAMKQFGEHIALAIRSRP